MSDLKHKLGVSLSAAISKTMENMTFEEVEIIDEVNDDDIFPEDNLWAVLPLLRPYEGQLVLEVPVNYGRTLAKEVLGLFDQNVSNEAIMDVLAEMANTLAGRFVDELVSSDREFELGLPDTGKGVAPAQAPKVATVQLNVAGHALVASIAGEAFKQFTETE